MGQQYQHENIKCHLTESVSRISYLISSNIEIQVHEDRSEKCHVKCSRQQVFHRLLAEPMRHSQTGCLWSAIVAAPLRPPVATNTAIIADAFSSAGLFFHRLHLHHRLLERHCRRRVHILRIAHYNTVFRDRTGRAHHVQAGFIHEEKSHTMLVISLGTVSPNSFLPQLPECMIAAR